MGDLQERTRQWNQVSTAMVSGAALVTASSLWVWPQTGAAFWALMAGMTCAWVAVSILLARKMFRQQGTAALTRETRAIRADIERLKAGPVMMRVPCGQSIDTAIDRAVAAADALAAPVAFEHNSTPIRVRPGMTRAQVMATWELSR